GKGERAKLMQRETYQIMMVQNGRLSVPSDDDNAAVPRASLWLGAQKSTRYTASTAAPSLHHNRAHQSIRPPCGTLPIYSVVVQQAGEPVRRLSPRLLKGVIKPLILPPSQFTQFALCVMQ